MRVSSKNHETSSKSISQHNFDRRSLNFSRHGIHTRGTQAHTSVRRIHRWWCFDSTNDFPSRVAGEKPLAIGRVSLCVNRRFEFRETQSAFVRTHNGPLSVVAMCVNNPNCSPVSFRCRGALEHRLQFCQLKLDAVLHDG